MCAAGQRIKNVFLPDCTVWFIVKRPGRFGNGFLLSRKEVPPVYARPPFFFFRFPSVLILLSPRSALSPCVRMLDELPTDELLPQLFCIFTMSGTSNLILLALLSRPKALIVRWELGRKKVRKDISYFFCSLFRSCAWCWSKCLTYRTKPGLWTLPSLGWIVSYKSSSSRATAKRWKDCPWRRSWIGTRSPNRRRSAPSSDSFCCRCSRLLGGFIPSWTCVVIIWMTFISSFNQSTVPRFQELIVNPVREALDYYRKLNEASRRNLEQPGSPPADSSQPVAGPAEDSTAAARPTSEQPVHPAEDERKAVDPPRHQQISAPPTTPISRERYIYRLMP